MRQNFAEIQQHARPTLRTKKMHLEGTMQFVTALGIAIFCGVVAVTFCTGPLVSAIVNFAARVDTARRAAAARGAVNAVAHDAASKRWRGCILESVDCECQRVTIFTCARRWSIAAMRPLC